jgi:hypothetical protein
MAKNSQKMDLNRGEMIFLLCGIYYPFFPKNKKKMIFDHFLCFWRLIADFFPKRDKNRKDVGENTTL